MSVLAPAGHECVSATTDPQPEQPLPTGTSPQPIDYLQSALTFRQFGWSVIPMLGKDPAGGWKLWQTRRMYDLQLGVAFRRRPGVTGLAVILGKVSGWLACRDFDSWEAYVEWARQHPDLAVACPTVRTRRGAHVYFRNKDKVERFISWLDGEFRANCKHYVMLPPSEHPKGGHYQWLSPEPVGESDFPWLRLADTGFLDADHPLAGWRKKTRKAPEEEVGQAHPDRNDQNTNTHNERYPTTSSVKKARSNKNRPPLIGIPHPTGPGSLQEAIRRCLPGGPGERHNWIFEFCRTLRGMACFESKEAAELEGVFRQWFWAALPFIRTKDWATSWKDFQDGWVRVLYPAGPGLAGVRLAVESGPLPAVVIGYEDVPTRKLFALCVGLANRNPDSVFFLSSRTAQEVCGFGNHVTANDRLKRFVRAGLLEEVTPGRPSATARVAPRYRLGGSPAVKAAMSSMGNENPQHAISSNP